MARSITWLERGDIAHQLPQTRCHHGTLMCDSARTVRSMLCAASRDEGLDAWSAKPARRSRCREVDFIEFVVLSRG